MIAESYRAYEVIRAADIGVMLELNTAIKGVAAFIQSELPLRNLRVANSAGNLTLLGMSKMEYAKDNSAYGSALRSAPQKTFGTIASELITTFSAPLHLSIDTFSIEHEKSRAHGNQSVVFAEFDKADRSNIGQDYAARRLEVESGNGRVRPYAPRIPLFFADAKLLNDDDRNVIKMRTVLFDTIEKALEDVDYIPYSRAKHPKD